VIETFVHGKIFPAEKPKAIVAAAAVVLPARGYAPQECCDNTGRRRKNKNNNNNNNGINKQLACPMEHCLRVQNGYAVHLVRSVGRSVGR